MPLATYQDACVEQARNEGRESPDRAWIWTFMDTWERNPFYAGPPVPHPEDYNDDYEVGEVGEVPAAQPKTWDDEIPF